jgi:hypothetical protein
MDHDPSRLVRDLVEASFPALSSWRIRVRLVSSDGYVAAVLPFRPLRRALLLVCKQDWARMSKRAARGVLAHELCHLEDAASTPIVKHALSLVWQCLSKSARANDERSADERVIAKGYGLDLLAFQEYHDREYEPYGQDDGLTLDEIRKRIVRTASPASPPGVRR